MVDGVQWRSACRASVACCSCAPTAVGLGEDDQRARTASRPVSISVELDHGMRHTPVANALHPSAAH